MSATIDIEYFQSWSEIFMEIESQKNWEYFAAIGPGNTTARRPSSNQGSRRDSKMDEIVGNTSETQQRARLASAPRVLVSTIGTLSKHWRRRGGRQPEVKFPALQLISIITWSATRLLVQWRRRER